MMIFPKGQYHQIYTKILTGDIVLVISNEITSEYLEIMGSFYSEKVAEYIINAILSHPKTHLVNSVYYKWDLITEDKDDNKFVDAYIASNADYLVTNDRHFNVLKDIEFPFVNVISIDSFLNLTN
jgi:uncharacterized protein